MTSTLARPRPIVLAWVVVVLFTGCGATPASVQPVTTHLRGTVTAGPVCPVERQPPDPACAPRPVVDAVLIIGDGDSGAEVARATTTEAGTYQVDLPPGAYTVEPQPVEGLLGTPGPQRIELTSGIDLMLDFDYDTGIR